MVWRAPPRRIPLSSSAATSSTRPARSDSTRSGQLTADDITGQTTRVFENLLGCLEAAGCGPADVIKVNAYLTDLGDFPGFNDVYRTVFQEPYPGPHDGRGQPPGRDPRGGRGGRAQARVGRRTQFPDK